MPRGIKDEGINDSMKDLSSWVNSRRESLRKVEVLGIPNGVKRS